jgi:mannose-6-phosphate isomerase
MELLHNPIRPYAWGSNTAIATLQGRPAPTAEPEAELWMGAHPNSPSMVDGPDGGTALDAVVAEDPEGVLGAPVAARFGERLPFMLKVVAARENLSLQAHPDAAQAAAGYESGVAGYVDRYAKPELLVALTDFDALCGFRHPEAAADALESLSVPALARVIALLRDHDAERALRGALETLLRWPADERERLVRHVAEAASGRPGLTYMGELAERYPGDMGVAVTLLLNHVSLAPGDAIWMPAGNLHAYLRGAGVEVLATSDNVLRGGLTAKPVNVRELLRVLRYQVLAEPLVKTVAIGPGVTTWPTPAAEFRLFHVRVAGTPAVLEISGPCIVLVTQGRVVADDLEILPGHAGFGRAASRLELRGDGVAFVATSGI